MNGDFLSTNELRKHVHREYKKLRKKAILSLVYRPLSTKFEICSPNSLDGEYCYSDEKGYYYAGRVRIVRPQINGTVNKIHYIFDSVGRYLGKR